MLRRLVLVSVLAVVAATCSSASDDTPAPTTSAASAPDDTSGPSTTLADSLSPTSTTTATPPPLRQASAERVTVSSDGRQADGHSGFGPSLSADGRLVAFGAEATNLVSDDTNGVGDVFLRDRGSNTTVRVSVASDGSEADGLSWNPTMSADGSVVVFLSDATNLVDGDENGRGDVFVHELATGETRQVSVSSDGDGGNALSAATRRAGVSEDGRFVVFQSFADNLVDGDTNGLDDVFLRDRQAGTTTLVSAGADGPADGPSFGPSLSADGRWVSFASQASNLVAGDANDRIDQFIVDLDDGSVEMLSVTPDGMPANGDVAAHSGSDVSSDGRFVAFVSGATDLVAGDTNTVPDIFVRDRHEGTTRLISVSSDGSEANGESGFPVLAAEGRLVVFESVASNLVEGDENALNDVFIHDVVSGGVERVGVMFDPIPGGVISGEGPNRAETFLHPDINPTGTIVAFFSEATTLVEDDTNGVGDAYVIVVSPE